MKENKIKSRRNYGPATVVVVIALAVIGLGITAGYQKLRDLYFEQCIIRDMASQVTINAGKMVHPSNIAEQLGLRPGANLATIDFAKKRAELLKDIPNLRSVRIMRRLPDRVVISVDERTPVARMGLRGSKTTTGRVVDTDGMVFVWQRGTQTLPTIREPQTPGVPKGQHIQGRTLAALRLIEACREPEFLELGILEVDVSKPDFLVATLGNYSKVKIAWDGMDEHTPAARGDLHVRLTNLVKAIRSRVAPDTMIWNATLPDQIFADTQGKL